MSQYDYDIITIGLGPAGMAVSGMAAELGLKVCAIEKHRIGGECLNVGCIPSKALLRRGAIWHQARLVETGQRRAPLPESMQPFGKIAQDLEYILNNKTLGIFKKIDLRLRLGAASFVDAHTVNVGEEKIRARRIFIATGTRPRMLPIPGLNDIDVLTNENIFQLERVPESMVIIGGGAIGCEMAQAFSRLGCRCAIVNAAPHLVPVGDADASLVLEDAFAKEGIQVYNGRQIARIEKLADGLAVHTTQGEAIAGERLLMAVGRHIELGELKLQNAGIETTTQGAIKVDKYLRTTQKNIFAVGDCNGHWQLSHAAMHQGMIGMMNSMLPWPMKKDFRKFTVPWSVFTDPQISHVGMREPELKEKGMRYESIRVNYSDYGAAIAEGVPVGFAKVLASPAGKIYGVSIVGEGSGEMINEWALAIQKKIRLHDILFLQHAFPTMGFLSKRMAEVWMMKKIGSSKLQRLGQWLFRH